MRPLHVINISGGKDSTAVACLAIERAERRDMEMRFMFADTGNEHPITLEHVDYLARALGVTIETVRADFTDRMAERRRKLPVEWRKEKKRRKHADDCDDPLNCGCPFSVSPPVPDEIINRAIELLQPTGNPYLDLCMLKGRFPSRRAQFCTEELKVEPCNEALQPVIDSGRSIVTWLGERAEESLNRAKKLTLQRVRMSATGNVSKILWRPIHKWKAAQTFEIAKRHGLEPNPLYQMGMGRVGCMPCINCAKGELGQIAKRFPSEINRIREWEKIVTLVSRRQEEMVSTFFPARTVPGKESDYARSRIDEAVKWARTTRGGKHYDLLGALDRIIADEDGMMCESAYGLCE